MLNTTRILALIGLALLSVTPALADDWQAVKLRGNVFTNNGGDWVRLNRGDIVSDDRVIRTLRSGRVEFRRGAETIEIGGATQIRIHDRTGQRYTTVDEDYGSVEVEAEHRNVRHFSVVTPLLAAIVKGTRFRVEYERGGKASVRVLRGLVEVEDTVRSLKVDVHPGQEAAVGRSSPLSVEGEGIVEPVTTASGEVVEIRASADAGQSAGLLGLLFGQGSPSASGGKGRGTLKSLTSGTSDIVNTTTSNVGDTVSSTVDTVAGTASTTIGAVEKTVRSVTDTTSSTVDKVADTVGSTVESTTGGVKKLVGGILGR